VIAFRGMVEHDIEKNLNTGPMQRLHHVAKLVHRTERILTRAVCLVRGKERHRRITPVVHPSWWTIRRVELKHRQQFNCGYAQLPEIWNPLDQTGKSTTASSVTPELGGG
jgi:hypothetical protein